MKKIIIFLTTYCTLACAMQEEQPPVSSAEIHSAIIRAMQQDKLPILSDETLHALIWAVEQEQPPILSAETLNALLLAIQQEPFFRITPETLNASWLKTRTLPYLESTSYIESFDQPHISSPAVILAQKLIEFRNLTLRNTILPHIEINTYSADVEERLFKHELTAELFFQKLGEYLHINDPELYIQEEILSVAKQREIFARLESHRLLNSLMSGCVNLPSRLAHSLTLEKTTNILDAERTQPQVSSEVPEISPSSATNQEELSQEPINNTGIFIYPWVQSSDSFNIEHTDYKITLYNSDGSIRYVKYMAPDKHPLVSVHISPDNKYVIGLFKNKILIWNSVTGRCIKKIWPKHRKITGLLTSLAWNSDSTHFITGTSNGRILIWNIEADEPEKKMLLGDGPITHISWSSNKDYVAVKSDNKDYLSIVSISQKEITSCFYEKLISGALFHHHARPYFMVHIPEKITQSRGDILIWDIIDKKIVPVSQYSQLVESINTSSSLATNSLVLQSPYGNFVFPDAPFFNIHNLLRPELMNSLIFFNAWKHLKPFSKVETTLVKAVNKIEWINETDYITVTDTVLQIVDSRTQKIKYKIRTDSKIIAFSYGYGIIAISEQDNKITLSDIASSDFKVIPLKQSTSLLSWQAGYLMVRTDFDTVAMYNKSGELIRSLNHGEFIHRIDSFAILPDFIVHGGAVSLSEHRNAYAKMNEEINKRIIIASRNYITVWSLADGILLDKRILETDDIAAGNINKLRLLIHDRTVYIWWLQYNEKLDSFTLPAPVSTVLARNNSNHIIVATTDGMIHVCDVKDTSTLKSYPAHSAPIYSMGWVSDSIFATASLDNTIKIWTAPGDRLQTIETNSKLAIVTNYIEQEDYPLLTPPLQTMRLETPRGISLSEQRYSYPFIALRQVDIDKLSTHDLCLTYRALLLMFLRLKLYFDSARIPYVPQVAMNYRDKIPEKHRPRLLELLLQKVEDIQLRNTLKIIAS